MHSRKIIGASLFLEALLCVLICSPLSAAEYTVSRSKGTDSDGGHVAAKDYSLRTDSPTANAVKVANGLDSKGEALKGLGAEMKEVNTYNAKQLKDLEEHLGEKQTDIDLMKKATNPEKQKSAAKLQTELDEEKKELQKMKLGQLGSPLFQESCRL